ncbi:SusD/RagB family nutrient-binding outer membrane lipoprotein [Chryseobacterium indologenes]|uniref:SusD/RagB family nutrient-binding outer membrane lipoprotein n=1 Tax=Chryseobacterium indologenes TaxID=253 RepID=A0AAD0YYA1_CHRID|nr:MULTISPECIES: SusD/RagB family nutrient-binding outer membrane lipoprotein [Chryseobacterium]AZB19173.1 SusD/RagB family nutrient-binding outer membrane lipoprotein [Chryseobacterium indologenes]
MKKYFKYKAFYLLMATGMFAVSCTSEFDKINSDYTPGLGDEQLNADFGQLVASMKLMQRGLVHYNLGVYQLQQNLNADMFSGYFATATPFNGNNFNSTYFMMDNWNERIMITQLEDVLNKKDIFKAVMDKTYPGYNFDKSLAIMDIVKVISSLKVSDVHGPVIYSKFNKPNSDGSTDFDSQADAYHYFIADLTKAITVLQNTTIAPEDKSVMKSADVFYGGDTVKWMKFANSLKFRIAMRMRYAAPADSKKFAEEALASPAGLIENNIDNALINYGTPSPAGGVIYDWGDCRSGAPLLAYLNGFKDPRISAYAFKATDPAAADQYIGIRQGIDLKGDKTFYVNYSVPLADAAGGAYFAPGNQNGRGKIFTAPETWFLKAEAALYGYAGAGDAKSNYEMGVRISMEEWGKSADYAAYISDDISTEQPYVDPKNAVNNIPAGNSMLSTVTIKWNETDNTERKLERIMTQKWLALYPDGSEAWAEQRRTGYPILFKNILNSSQGNIDTDKMIRRIPISTKYRNNNPVGYQKAAATLGGPDNGGTKLWWDKKL